MTERELLGSGCSEPVCAARPPLPSLQKQWERFQVKQRRVGQEGGTGRLYRAAVHSEMNIHTVRPHFKISDVTWILNIGLPKMDLNTKMGCKVKSKFAF